MIKNLIAKQKAKGQLLNAFKTAEIGVERKFNDTTRFIYPKIQDVRFNYEKKTLTYVFTLPYGVDPKILKKKEYVFQQFFSKNIEIKGEIKTFTLTIFTQTLPSTVKYDYKKMNLKGKLPIPVGLDKNGEFYFYELSTHPHLLLAGETGSGKSTEVRSIITSLIQYKAPSSLHLFLCDLKMGDFHIFRNVEHVKSFDTNANELKLTLTKLKAEMTKRGKKLLEHEVSHIDDLPSKLPYIILAIDEVALLKKEKECMDIIEQISSIGRSLGVFLILSMQRPDAKLLDGKLKVNLTVRMAFRCSDGINSRIVIDKVGAEKLDQTGRMLLKIQGERDLKEIQAPYLSIDKAKEILESYKVVKVEAVENQECDSLEGTSEESDSIFGVLDDEKA
ncbi:DUF87 domain-containing protein [Sutcliffiella horikoshii]|uniref:FtsK/SpoIIIE domain-containing protein n=1 Tax=Sutcliffiella horikoshii TaxID=79883 RepID=UPI00384E5175